MSLWSGATLYERYLDPSQKEMWIPKGFTQEDLLYCWKVKLDPQSGKHFFVNRAGFGKAWRLPDIYDPSVQEKLRRFAEGVLDARNDAHREGLHHHAAAAHHRHPEARHGDSTPTFSVGSDRRHHSTPHQHQSSRNTPHHQSRDMPLNSSSMQPPIEAEPVIARHDFAMASSTPPPAATAGGDSRASNVDAFDYGGNDEEWGIKPSSGRSSVTPSTRGKTPAEEDRAKQLAEKERERLAQIEAEKAAMLEQMGLASGGADVFDPYAGTEVASPTKQRSPSPPADDASPEQELMTDIVKRTAELEVQYMMHSRETQERMLSLGRDAQAIEYQRELMDAAYVREQEALARFEEQQSATVAAETELVKQRLAEHDSPVATRPPPSTSFSPASAEAPATLYRPDPNSAMVPVEGDDLASPGPPPPPYASASPARVDENNSKALVMALEQLEQARAMNARLKDENDEKDRLLMEHMVAEAERERREIALRIRMVESLAAYRREKDIEQQFDIEREEMRTIESRLGGGSDSASPVWSQRYIPAHPLE